MIAPAVVQPCIDAARRTRNRLANLLDHPVVVLIYHRVTILPTDPHLLAVSPANFRVQMRYLKENFPVLRFEDDWSGIKKPAVAVTFDDGYADNALEALPVLEEVGVPATFFVSTGTIGTKQEFWWDELARIFAENTDYPASFTLEDQRYGRSWVTGAVVERQVLCHDLQRLMKMVDAQRRDAWFRQLRRWASTDEKGSDINRAMSVDELRHLAGSKWATIGAHTVTHTPLSSLPPEAQLQEITESRRQLESWLGRDIAVFSYPFGDRSDYTKASRKICKKAGFVRGASNFPGQAHWWTDPYQIPRQLVRNWDARTFAARMRGFWI